MPTRASHNSQPNGKPYEDNVKLLIALRRALGTHAKTPAQVHAAGVKHSHH